MKGATVDKFNGSFYRGKDYEISLQAFIVERDRLIERLIAKYGERRVKAWLKNSN